MKKPIIVGVTVAAVVLLVGVVAYMLIQRTVSTDDAGESTAQPLDGSVCDAAWSPDGHTILYDSLGVRIIDADGTNGAYLGKGGCPTWSPDGHQIAFSTDNGVQVMNADGSEKRLLVGLAEIVLPPLAEHKQIESTAWSPDGRMIAIEVSASVPTPSDESAQARTSIDGTWVVNADGTGLRQLTAGSADCRDPAWSPDGQRIAFIADADGSRADIWTSRADGTDLRQLTASDEIDSGISWSPDGSKIAFVSGYWDKKDEYPQIWIMDADGGHKVQLTEGPEWYDGPAWSPDGSMIAFSSLRSSFLGDIWIMNADGSGKTRLTRTSSTRTSGFNCTRRSIRHKEPQWSPDGTKLLFLDTMTKGGGTWDCDRLWVLGLDLGNGLS